MRPRLSDQSRTVAQCYTSLASHLPPESLARAMASCLVATVTTVPSPLVTTNFLLEVAVPPQPQAVGLTSSYVAGIVHRHVSMPRGKRIDTNVHVPGVHDSTNTAAARRAAPALSAHAGWHGSATASQLQYLLQLGLPMQRLQRGERQSRSRTESPAATRSQLNVRQRLQALEPDVFHDPSGPRCTHVSDDLAGLGNGEVVVRWLVTASCAHDPSGH